MTAPVVRMDERRRRQRAKNLALLGVLVAVVALFYILTLIRISGGH